MTIKRVAFIGAGNMGAPMARRVYKAGFDLTVCDRSEAVLDTFRSEGVHVTQDARECAFADAVIVLVAADEQIVSVTAGPDGVAAGVRGGHRPTICIMSTTLPKTLQHVVERLHGTGVRLLDAPVSGGIVRAEAGTLTIMVGGAAEDVEEARPLMNAMGNRIFHCGELGSAQVVKLINNMLCITMMYLGAEAIELADSYGVRFEHIAPILEVSTGRNFLTSDPAEGMRQYGAWARSPEAFSALVKIVSKDLHLAAELGEGKDLDLRLLKIISKHVDGTDQAIMNQWMRHGGVR